MGEDERELYNSRAGSHSPKSPPLAASVVVPRHALRSRRRSFAKYSIGPCTYLELLIVGRTVVLYLHMKYHKVTSEPIHTGW